MGACASGEASTKAEATSSPVKQEVATGTTPGDAKVQKGKNPSGSKFFVVHHYTKADKKDAWWANMQENMPKMEEMTKDWAARGLHNHAMHPIGDGSMIFCTWEAKEGTDPKNLQKLLDEEVGNGMMSNIIHEVNLELLGGQAPWEAKFVDDSKATAAGANPGESRFFVVHHYTKAGDHTEKWWAGMQEKMAKMDEISKGWEAKGMYNHAFVPCTQNMIFCLWELKKGTDPSVLQKTLDEENEGHLNNVLHELNLELTGKQAPYPPHFTA